MTYGVRELEVWVSRVRVFESEAFLGAQTLRKRCVLGSRNYREAPEPGGTVFKGREMPSQTEVKIQCPS